MLVSEPGRELSMAVLKPLAGLADEEIAGRFRVLEDDARKQLTNEGCEAQNLRFRHRLELRYKGQSATIAIDWSAGGAHEALFHHAHQKASGLRLPHPVELVNLRLSARAPAVLKSIDIRHESTGAAAPEETYMPELDRRVPVRARADLQPGVSLEGPLLITESAATAWIKPGWVVRLDEWGNLHLNIRK
jgi:N-methylhydantoinase A/oxoprolinase/acetone carboxylase beta subunit